MADDALTRKEAEMGRLTRKEIEYLVGQFALLAARAEWKPKSIDRIRTFGDLALRALSLESVREEALAEWSRQVRLIVRGIDAQAERLTRREQTTWRDGENQAPDPDEDFEDVVIGYKLNTGLWHRLLGLLASCPAPESALQHAPARVAEGEKEKK